MGGYLQPSPAPHPSIPQATLLNYFCEVLQQVIQNAKQSGKFDAGVADLRGESIVKEEAPVEVWRDRISGMMQPTAVCCGAAAVLRPDERVPSKASGSRVKSGLGGAPLI